MNNIMNGADAIVKCLEQEGVTTVYGYPGGAIAPFKNRTKRCTCGKR